MTPIPEDGETVIFYDLLIFFVKIKRPNILIKEDKKLGGCIKLNRHKTILRFGKDGSRVSTGLEGARGSLESPMPTATWAWTRANHCRLGLTALAKPGGPSRACNRRRHRNAVVHPAVDSFGQP
jgi:hypothetical protein